MSVRRTSAPWPPPCEMPDCPEAREPGLYRTIDFGAGGKRLLALCAGHGARTDAGAADPE